MNTTNEDWRMKEKPILTRLEKAEGGWGQRLQALEGRAREAEAALQESLLRQEKMAAMYEESILERAGEEAADSEDAPRCSTSIDIVVFLTLFWPYLNNF